MPVIDLDSLRRRVPLEIELHSPGVPSLAQICGVLVVNSVRVGGAGSLRVPWHLKQLAERPRLPQVVANSHPSPTEG